VVDREGLIIHVVTGEPGARNDKGVFNDSGLRQDDHLYFEDGEVLLADGPGEGKLMIPACRPDVIANPDLAEHNRELRSARAIVERTIGLLKLKFPVTSKIWARKKDIQPTVFHACCLLTNFYIRRNGWH
jgi:hypothetical protein